jgi:hypothetical protein
LLSEEESLSGCFNIIDRWRDINHH